MSNENTQEPEWLLALKSLGGVRSLDVIDYAKMPPLERARLRQRDRAQFERMRSAWQAQKEKLQKACDDAENFTERAKAFNELHSFSEFSTRRPADFGTVTSSRRGSAA